MKREAPISDNEEFSPDLKYLDEGERIITTIIKPNAEKPAKFVQDLSWTGKSRIRKKSGQGTKKKQVTLVIKYGEVAFLYNQLRSSGKYPRKQPVRQAPKLLALVRWNGLLPSPGLRKQTSKMLADQQAHIRELHDAGRTKAAQWQAVCTYGLWLWYVTMRPISSVAKNLRGKVGGA